MPRPPGANSYRTGWAAVRMFDHFGGCTAMVVPDNLLCGAPHNKFYVE